MTDIIDSNPVPVTSQVNSTKEPPIKWQIFTALDPTVERIFPSLAKEIGLNESIVLMQISFWIGQSTNVRNGAYWTYHSLRDMQRDFFPYWGVETVRRTIKNLEKRGFIIVKNFNKRKGDNTQWFSLVPDTLSSLTSVLIAPSIEGKGVSNRDTETQIETPPHQNETTLPETTTETIKSITPPKPRPINPVTPWHDALLLCFNLKPDTVTKSADRTYWTAASELSAIKFPVEYIPDLYRWCALQGWKTFSVMAMAKHAGEWLAKRSNNISVLDGLRIVS